MNAPAVRKPLTALGIALCTLLPGALATNCSGSTESTDIGVSQIIFVKRAHTTVDQQGNVAIDVAGGNTQVIDYDRYVPGGSLDLLSPPRPDGKVINLTADFPTADFNGVDVSFDAKQAVFSMKKDGSDHYHLYTVQLTPGADGKYEIHQKTAGDYDDINPIYMPGGRIAFATNEMYTAMGTRADEYEHGRVVTQLASITVDGGDADRHLDSQNLSHTVAPFLRHDGKVGYSRWEHLGPVNDVKIFTASPDGTQMLAVAGQHNKPVNSLINIREIEPNVMIGIGTTRNRTIHAGTLIRIDARNHNDPVCLDKTADQTGHACLDEEHATFTILTPDVPGSNGPSPDGRYREPSVLPDGRILVSWADGPVNDLNEQSQTPPDFGIYVFDPVTQKNQLIYNDRTMWSLGAMAVAPRVEPPVIGDLQRGVDGTQPVRIGSVNVTNTSLTDSINGAEFKNTPLGDALKGAVKVRIIEGFSSEAAKGVTMFGLTMHEGAAVLGEADVYPDGSWLANIPPYIPFHLQPIDKFGLSIRSQGLWIQGMPGEDRRCVGCHESRTGQGVPAFGQNPTVAEQKGPEDFTEAITDRTEYPWNANDDPNKSYVQQVLDAKCVQCHNDTKNGNGPQTFYTVSMTNPVSGVTSSYQIPRFNMCGLTANQYCDGQPLTVYYDRQVKPWPKSYVSIFYPSTLMMDMGAKVTGTVPPMWGDPGNARGSEMIAHINVKAADGTTAWPATDHPMHPEDVGVTLTDEERQTLIRSIDLGGQYYARQNTQFVPFQNDPTSGQKYN